MMEIIRSCFHSNALLWCFILNGLIFLGSIFFFDHVVIPVIHIFGELLQSSGASDYKDNQAKWVREMIDGFIFLLYQVLWMYPIYCISFILNTIWYQEIADEAYLQHHGKPRTTPVSNMIRFLLYLSPRVDLFYLLFRDELYRALLVACFLLQILLSSFIPFIGRTFSFICLSWLYSLYCFEYKWSLHGWSIEKRLNHLEQHWAFFAGFGSPFTMATFFVPNFVSKGIFALLFPVFLLLAICCDPIASENTKKLPVFRQSKWMSLQVLRTLSRWTGLKNRNSRKKNSD